MCPDDYRRLRLARNKQGDYNTRRQHAERAAAEKAALQQQQQQQQQQQVKFFCLVSIRFNQLNIPIFLWRRTYMKENRYRFN